jgi:hypothetical protein
MEQPKDKINNAINFGLFNTIYQNIDSPATFEKKSKKALHNTQNAVLYYPYFELEKLGHVTNIDHKLYIKVFSLISDKILLPPCHLLDAGVENLFMLENNFSAYVESEIITSSYRKGQSSLSDFIESKRIDKDKWTKNREFASGQVNSFFSRTSNLIVRDTQNQSRLFGSLLNKGFFGSNSNQGICENLSSNEVLYLHKGLENIQEQRGYQISKSDIDKLFTVAKTQNKIEAENIEKLQNFANITYFHCGGKGNNSFIGYSQYFDSSKTYKDILTDGENGTNLTYDPLFFVNFLIATGAIKSQDDISNLTFKEILSIRSTSEFSDFLEIYRDFARTCSKLEKWDGVETALIKEYGRQNIIHLFKKSGFLKKIIIILKDYFGKDSRILTAKFDKSYFIADIVKKKTQLSDFCLILTDILTKKKKLLPLS